MQTGAVVGVLACTSFAALGGLAAPIVLSAAVAGYAAGAVVGLVLWSGSPQLPEDPILPPHPEQARSRRR